MTAGGTELAFMVSAREEAGVRALLDLEMLRRENPMLYLMVHPAALLTVQALLVLACTIALILYLPRIVTRALDNAFEPIAFLGLVLACLTLLILARVGWSWIARIRHREESPAQAGREGVRWGAQRMIVGPENFTVCRAAQILVYRWAAVSGLRKTRTMILLMLTPKQAIIVPRRAFESRESEQRFCEFVGGRITELQ